MLGAIDMLGGFLLLMFWTAVVVAAGNAAYARGRFAFPWMLGVAVFPPALIILLSLEADHGQLIRRQLHGKLGRDCPSCREPIQLEATACPHCTRDVPALQQPAVAAGFS